MQPLRVSPVLLLIMDSYYQYQQVHLEPLIFLVVLSSEQSSHKYILVLGPLRLADQLHLESVASLRRLPDLMLPVDLVRLTVLRFPQETDPTLA